MRLELKKDRGDLEELKNRIDKAQKNIDTLFAAYLREDSTPTSERLLAGLEIMAQRAAVGIAEENRRILTMEIADRQARLTQLDSELDVARKAFNASLYDEQKLEKEIQLAQSHFEKKQMEFSRSEAYAIGVRGSGQQERAVKHLMAQKSLQSSVEEALAWTNLAFHRLKYNLIMHVNNRFKVDSSEMRDKLSLWKEHLDKVLLQQEDWEKLTLQEQDRVRKDQGIQIADNAGGEANLMRVHENRLRMASETLALIQRLGEDIASVQWLIHQLEHSLRANSNFLERWWGDLSDYFSAIWQGLLRKLNISLFKIMEIPITLLTLLRIALILAISFFVSFILRFVISHFGKRKDISESTSYNLGRLAHYLVLLIGAIVVLCSIGLDFSNVMILAGALTFGIGFGLQSVAMNFLCGLRILFEGKIKIGDYIELQTGHYGKVTEIHVQNTVIYTNDGSRDCHPQFRTAEHSACELDHE